MPTYEYACTACAEHIEVVQRFTDASLTECPSCSGRLRKVFSPVGVVFKGSGFYKNDSRDSAKSGAKKADSSASGPGKTDGGSEAKPSDSGGADTKSAGAGATSTAKPATEGSTPKSAPSSSTAAAT